MSVITSPPARRWTFIQARVFDGFASMRFETATSAEVRARALIKADPAVRSVR